SLQKDFQDFLIRMAYIAEAKEWDNRSHIERIRRFTAILCDAMNMLPQDVETVSYASMLHDIGKTLIPDELLKKAGKFEQQDWGIVEQHTIHGAQILHGSNSLILQNAEIIALTHHERWDGSGYPKGLKGEEIPLSGQICAIADVFDALTTPRPYKQAIDDDEGLRIIQTASGKLFSPQLVSAFSSRFQEIQKAKRVLSK
ncbi:MAG: HD domain-containing phosphohydrolase, partial [Anaerolineales bacterium]